VFDGAASARPRLWRAVGDALVPAYVESDEQRIPLPREDGPAHTADGGVIRPLGTGGGLWLETPPGREGDVMHALFSLFLRADRESAHLSEELASRYEEIDLLYSINDILGQTLQLEDAANSIIREVSAVVGAGRASMAVLDAESACLRTVAAMGFDGSVASVIQLDDPVSVAARAVREGEPQIGEAAPGPGAGRDRGYRGAGFMSVPITYRAPGGAPRCVGVINLTDRISAGRFSATDQKLVTAAANQIGAAIELARMVARQREQQRLQDQLELAHHLQRSLLPSPEVLRGDAEVAVRCVQTEQVGGDFYYFNRLGLGLVGVMVGDVSSHGIPAAIVMAAVMSAAGIHATAGDAPDQALTALGASLAAKFASSDTYLTVFYGILDPINRRLRWASAGHPHAFRLPAEGPPERLEATAAPLGLGTEAIECRTIPWNAGRDLLCLWTDGLVDAQNEAGERFGEGRLLAALSARRGWIPELIVAGVMAEADGFAPRPEDDRTLLVLRL
jgi:sigma-B regulation protein RsbU (phosphoserine phosphatase)